MRRSMRIIQVIRLAGMVGTLVLPGLAQSDRASMVGVTKDASGAAIPNAKIKITNVATGQTFETESNPEGRYATPNILKPGTYKVEASKEGFKTAVVDQVILNIGDVKEVNIPLELGAITQTVTVSEQTQQLETETSSRGEVITGRQITELPLKDRNFTSLALLAPGVNRAIVGPLFDQTALNQGDKRISGGDISGQTNEQGSTEASRFSRSGGASLSVNGLRPTTNNFSLDGVDNNEPQFGTIGVFPNPDAIAEFKVTTSVPPAEVGRAAGAVINTTIKSGTNEFHGSGYYYGQNSALNAYHPRLRRDRVDAISRGVTNLSPFNKAVQQIHEFGGTLGGRIIRNRTFFFADYLGQRNNIPFPAQSTVHTLKSRTGDFSEFPTIFNPFTGQAFTGNVIPTNLLSPIAVKRPGSFPSPTVNILNPSQSNNNYFTQRDNKERINNFEIKIDHKVNEKNSLTGRVNEQKLKTVRANLLPGLPTAGVVAGGGTCDTKQMTISHNPPFQLTAPN